MEKQSNDDGITDFERGRAKRILEGILAMSRYRGAQVAEVNKWTGNELFVCADAECDVPEIKAALDEAGIPISYEGHTMRHYVNVRFLLQKYPDPRRHRISIETARALGVALGMLVVDDLEMRGIAHLERKRGSIDCVGIEESQLYEHLCREFKLETDTPEYNAMFDGMYASARATMRRRGYWE